MLDRQHITKGQDPKSATHTRPAAQEPELGGLTRSQQNILTAQRTIGNRAVVRRMIQRDPIDGDPAASPAAGNPQSLTAGGDSVTASGSGVSIQSSGPLTVSAPAIDLHTAMLTVDGVTKTSTIIADSVVASSYTPGAGNIW